MSTNRKRAASIDCNGACGRGSTTENGSSSRIEPVGSTHVIYINIRNIADGRCTGHLKINLCQRFYRGNVYSNLNNFLILITYSRRIQVLPQCYCLSIYAVGCRNAQQ
ncbi:hypothetical protein DSECCO2_662600 [anaerobic digester metagenome]